MEVRLRNTTFRAALAEAKRRLNSPATAAVDAEILLGYVLGATRSYLHTWPERNVDTAQLAQFYALIERRRAGEPIAYITGRREFWSLELNVTRDTLIPRAETELLVELALQRIPAPAVWNIADLGTGCGAIALALARERPHCKIVAADISPAALEVARANARQLNIHNIEFRLADITGQWHAPLKAECFDMIVSNPPYVSSHDPHLTQDDLRFEPRMALEAGADGLRDLRAIATQVRPHLKPGAWLLLEHGFDQAAELARILSNLGYHDIEDYEDIAGMPRTICAYWRGS